MRRVVASFDYFGGQAGPSGQGYYSFRSGDWLVLSLNSNLPVGAATSQGQWISAHEHLYERYAPMSPEWSAQ